MGDERWVFATILRQTFSHQSKLAMDLWCSLFLSISVEMYTCAKVTWRNSQKQTKVVLKKLMVHSPWHQYCVIIRWLLPPPPHFPDQGSCYFCIPEIKISDEMSPFWHHWWHKYKYVKCIVNFKKSLPALLCKVQTPLGKGLNLGGGYFELHKDQ